MHNGTWHTLIYTTHNTLNLNLKFIRRLQLTRRLIKRVDGDLRLKIILYNKYQTKMLVEGKRIVYEPDSSFCAEK